MIKLFKKIEKWNGNSNNVIKKKNPITEKSSNITDKNSNEEKKKNKGKSRMLLPLAGFAPALVG